MSERVIRPSGPAYVPPEMEWPPIHWGTTLPWEKRVEHWRAQPAKERRGTPGERQLADPWMEMIVTIGDVGEVRWSNGHGRWPLSRFGRAIGRASGMLKRGYWLHSDNGRAPQFLGETIDEAHNTIGLVLKGRAECLRIDAVTKAFALESELKRHIDKLNADADRASASVESVSSTCRLAIAKFEAKSKERVLDDMVTALTSRA
jgi:hypothetical protein